MPKRIKELKIRVPGISAGDARNLAEGISGEFTGRKLQKIGKSGQTTIRVKMRANDKMNNENIIRAIRDKI